MKESAQNRKDSRQRNKIAEKKGKKKRSWCVSGQRGRFTLRKEKKKKEGAMSLKR